MKRRTAPVPEALEVPFELQRWRPDTIPWHAPPGGYGRYLAAFAEWCEERGLDPREVRRARQEQRRAEVAASRARGVQR